MNVVATDTGTLVEVQGTGEGATFPRSTLDKMLDAAQGACDKLFVAQREALALPYPGVLPEGARRRRRSEADPAVGDNQPLTITRDAGEHVCAAGRLGVGRWNFSVPERAGKSAVVGNIAFSIAHPEPGVADIHVPAVAGTGPVG